MKSYKYGLAHRPAMPGTVPTGYYGIDHSSTDVATYGIIWYERELAAQELDDFELVNLNKRSETGLTIKEAYSLISPVRNFADQEEGNLFSLEIMAMDHYHEEYRGDESCKPEKKRLTCAQWIRVCVYANRYYTSRAAEKLVRANAGSFYMELADSNNRVAVTGPCTYNPGNTKVAMYDYFGPISDMTFADPLEAIQESIKMGYKKRSPGLLDKILSVHFYK